MVNGDDMPDSQRSDSTEYVAVVVARSLDHAETYRELLADHDIPSILGTEDESHGSDDDTSEEGPAMTRGVPVLVPEGLLDEAGEIIADREDFEELNEEDDLDEDDEQFSLEDGMTEETGPALGGVEFLDNDEGEDDSDDDADYA